LRSHEQRHRSLLHDGPHLDVRDLLALLDDPLELLLRLLGMGDLPTAETDREFYLMTCLEEPVRGARLGVEVVLVRLRTQLDLLDLDDALLALGLASLLLLVVLELAEIEDLADRRVCLWIHLDEIEALLLRAAKCFGRLHDAEHLATLPDDPNLGDPDPL